MAWRKSYVRYSVNLKNRTSYVLVILLVTKKEQLNIALVRNFELYKLNDILYIFWSHFASVR